MFWYWIIFYYRTSNLKHELHWSDNLLYHHLRSPFEYKYRFGIKIYLLIAFASNWLHQIPSSNAIIIITITISLHFNNRLILLLKHLLRSIFISLLRQQCLQLSNVQEMEVLANKFKNNRHLALEVVFNYYRSEIKTRWRIPNFT